MISVIGQFNSMATSLWFCLLLLCAATTTFAAPPGTVCINYGRVANNLPTPSQVVQLLKSQSIPTVKIYDVDSSVLNAFSNTNINLIVALSNEQLSSAAASQSFTDNWVQSNILPYYPKTKIITIAVGNEVFTEPKNTKYLVPAMSNMINSLNSKNLNSIKVSSPIALTALASSYPPSSGAFKSDLKDSVMKPMCQLLRKTNSSLMMNVYPFFAYSDNSGKISLDYALFRQNAGQVDSGNGLKYMSLFDAQVDAVHAAMKGIGYDDVKLVVSETGWPSKGDSNEIGASEANAAAYNGNLVKKVLTGNGTPLKPDESLNVCLFALFNENQKPGPTSERNYGLFYPDQKRVYEIPLSSEQLKSGVASNGSKVQVGSPAEAPGQSFEVGSSPAQAPVASVEGQTWCVANGKVSESKLQEALDYACGEGKADCGPIQEGSSCYNPDSLVAHASYAFNSYYQNNQRGVGTCDFGGSAYVVTQPPSYGACKFPTGAGN